MGQPPRHGDEPEPLLRAVAATARDILTNGDAVLLVLVGLGALLWPLLGWLAALSYVALLAILALTVRLARRRG